MTDIPDTSSDEYSGEDEGVDEAVLSGEEYTPLHHLTRSSSSNGPNSRFDRTEATSSPAGEISDVAPSLSGRRAKRRNSTPSSAVIQSEEPTYNRQLVPCRTCGDHQSLVFCLQARNREGDPHIPRLKVIHGEIARRRCKALLVAGQRGDPSAETGSRIPENGSMEQLPLTAENMRLRFQVPCEACSNLGMCARKAHAEEMKHLSELTPHSSRPAKKASRPSQSSKRPVVKVEEDLSTRAPTRRFLTSRRRVVEVEGRNILMPSMISASTTARGVVEGPSLSLYLAHLSIHSDCREDVPGDFAANDEMIGISKGSVHFANLPAITTENIIRLRALRDTICWKYSDEGIHPLVAAKVLNLWERHHPQESRQLSTLIEGNVDKEFRIQVCDGGISAVFSASELRELQDRKAQEIKALLDSFTDADIRAAEPLVEVDAVSSPLSDGASASARGTRRCISSPSTPTSEGGLSSRRGGHGDGIRSTSPDIPRRAIDSSPAAEVVVDAPTSSASRFVESNGVGQKGISVTTVPGASSRASRHNNHSILKRGDDVFSPAGTRRKRVKEVEASDGKWYYLPSCIREKDGRLSLYVSLRTHKIDGHAMYHGGASEHAPLQRNYGRGAITRENLLALKAMRDLVYRNPFIHRIVAADVFELWENLQKDHPPRADDAFVTVSGVPPPSSTMIPEGTFKAGELRQLRGTTRRTEVDRILEEMRKSDTVMAGVLEEVPSSENASTCKEMTEPDAWIPSSATRNEDLSSSSADADETASSRGKRRHDNLRRESVPLADRPPKRPSFRGLPDGMSSSNSRSSTRLESVKQEGVMEGNGGGKEEIESGPDGGDDSDAAGRRAAWLRAVEENDAILKREQERVQKERIRAKDVHLARSMELMQWMVDEQSGQHTGSDGPPWCV